MRVSPLRIVFGVFVAALAWSLAVAPVDAQRRRRTPTRTAQASEGTLVVQSEQDGAEVYVDDELVGSTPLAPITLSPGSHTLRVRLPGHTEFTDVVRIQAGSSTDVPVELFPLSHVLVVETDPSAAHVYVDGTFMGESPVELELLEGTHSLRFTARGYEEAIREVQSRAGVRETLRLSMTALPEGLLDAGPRETQWFEEPTTWIAIGGGAVAIAATIAIIVVVTSASSTPQFDAFCAPGCLTHDPGW